jgi:hypothetical protein
MPGRSAVNISTTTMSLVSTTNDSTTMPPSGFCKPTPTAAFRRRSRAMMPSAPISSSCGQKRPRRLAASASGRTTSAIMSVTGYFSS